MLLWCDRCGQEGDVGKDLTVIDAVRIVATVVECARFWTVDRTSTQQLIDAFCKAALEAGFRLPMPKDDVAEEPYSVAEVQD